MQLGRNKNAVRLVPTNQADWIRKRKADRIMGSRFVITRKAQEDVIENGIIPQEGNPDHWKVKARFCLQGHLDPDLDRKAHAGLSNHVTNGTNDVISTVVHSWLENATW